MLDKVKSPNGTTFSHLKPQDTVFRGDGECAKIDWQFTFAMAAYNLVRLPKLLKAPA